MYIHTVSWGRKTAPSTRVALSRRRRRLQGKLCFHFAAATVPSPYLRVKMTVYIFSTHTRTTALQGYILLNP